MAKRKLEVQNGSFAICKLDPSESIPEWATIGPFFSVTRTIDELSIVCLEKNVPPATKAERGWRSFKVQGTLAFSEVGILSDLSEVLARHRISIFVISTHDTDYLLVKGKDLKTARVALQGSGYDVK